MIFNFVSKTGDCSFTFEDILALIIFSKDKDGRSFYSRYEEGSELTEVLLYDFLKSSLGLVPAYFEEFYVLVNAVICALDKGDPSPWIRAELEVEDESVTPALKIPRRIHHSTAFYLRFYSQDPLPTL